MDHGRAKRSPWGVLLEVHLGREVGRKRLVKKRKKLNLVGLVSN